MNNYLKLILAVLFLICLLDMPYGYYQLVRLIGMIGFFALTVIDYNNHKKFWTYFWIGSAVLINPLIKIPLERELWNLIDITWAVILIIKTIINK